MIILKIISLASFTVMTVCLFGAGILGYVEEHKLSRAFHARPKPAVKTK
ncbi:MAG: hypothetical protein ACYCX4_05630 [Bacillota bacterium]